MQGSTHNFSHTAAWHVGSCWIVTQGQNKYLQQFCLLWGQSGFWSYSPQRNKPQSASTAIQFFAKDVEVKLNSDSTFHTSSDCKTPACWMKTVLFGIAPMCLQCKMVSGMVVSAAAVQLWARGVVLWETFR